jgi:hypothetical protein
MKTLIKFSFLFFLFLVIFSFNSNCQIKVFSNNYVGINYNSTPLSRFVINGAGSSAYQAYIYNPNISISGGAFYIVSEKGTGSGNHIYGHFSQTNIGSGNNLYGIKSTAYSSSAYSTGRTYGIYGLAGNASNGYNYAVYGSLSGTRYGAAVFGAVNGLGDVGLSAQYAGYFRGNIKCENVITCVDLVETSDEKFKTNIIDLEPTEAIENLLKINPVKYNLKQVEITQTIGDTISVTKFFNESDQLFTKTKYGVIAQELQKIYPDLVFEEGDGSLAVKYTGLIPVIIEAMQAQQKKIEELEALIMKIAKEANIAVRQ